MRTVYEKVSIKSVKVWLENGRRRQRTKEFFQTINPFNLNTLGEMKTRDEILREELAKSAKWMIEEKNK